MESLAGAAYLLKSNEGVQSEAHAGRKPAVEHKSKSFIDLVHQRCTVL